MYYSTSTLEPVNPPMSVKYGDPPRWRDTRRDAPDRDVHLAAVGIVELDDSAPKPADTATDTHDRTIELVDDVPTVVWVQRPWTREELAEKNKEALRSDPQVQIDALITSVVALQAILARTNADINSNPAAVIKDVTRELLTVTRRLVRLARLQLGALDSTEGA